MITEDDKTRFWFYVEKLEKDECWPWRGAYFKDKPYGQFFIRGKNYRSNRLAYMLSNNLQEIAPTLVVMHSCDNPSCCNPKHLHLGSSKENSQDMSYKNRAKNGRTITSEIIEEVFKLMAEGKNNMEIQRITGVSNSYVSKLRNGKFRCVV